MTVLAQVPYHTFPDFQVGPLTIRTFGLMVALGIILGVFVAARYVANRGLDPDEYTNLATKVAIVGLVGARITWVLSHLETIESPIDVVAVWEGGMQFSGALIFGAAATWWWSRNRYEDEDRWILLDATGMGVAIGLAVGRIGCMAVGEHFGGPTDFFLGMTYRGGGTVEPGPAIGETIHNTAFYEFLHLVVLLAIIAVLLRRAGDRDHPLVPGTILGLFLTWYGVGRFLTDFLRIHDSHVAGLTGAQWGSIVIAILGTWILATGSRRAERFAAQALPSDADRPRPSNVRVLPDEADPDRGDPDAEGADAVEPRGALPDTRAPGRDAMGEAATSDAAPSETATSGAATTGGTTDEAATDQAATNEVATSDTATSDTATNAAATDEAATSDTATTAAATDDAATDVAATSDTATNGAATDDAATSDTATSGAATSEAATDDTATSEAATDEAAADDEPTVRPTTPVDEHSEDPATDDARTR